MEPSDWDLVGALELAQDARQTSLPVVRVSFASFARTHEEEPEHVSYRFALSGKAQLETPFLIAVPQLRLIRATILELYEYGEIQ